MRAVSYTLLIVLLSAGVASADDTSPQACAECHSQIVAEWKKSRHSISATNSLFLLEYEPKRKHWCRTCHSPRDTSAGNTKAGLAARGVDCVACHVQDGVFVSRRTSPRSPHNTKATPAFGSSKFCAGCHQFNFPILDDRGMLEYYTDEPMQDTVEQYRQAPRTGGRTCVSCHMRQEGHRFSGSFDLHMLKKAIEVSACRRGNQLEISLHNKGAAHNVPSGGVHRSIAVRFWHSLAPDKMQTYYLKRTFSKPGAMPETLSDTTIPANGTRKYLVDVSQLVPPTETPAINVELRYIYGDQEFRVLENHITRQAFVTKKILFPLTPRCT